MNESGQITKGSRAKDVFLEDYDAYLAFNKEGNIVTGKYYESDGNLAEKVSSKYDTQGKKIKETEINFETKQKWIYLFTYDSQGKKVEMKTCRPNGALLNRSVYTYNPEGYLVEEQNFDTEGVFLDKWIFIQDEKGNYTEKTRFDKNGEMAYKAVYTYDEKGIMNHWISYNANGMVLADIRYSYRFDDYGNWIQKIQYKVDKPCYLTERKIEYFKSK